MNLFRVLVLIFHKFNEIIMFPVHCLNKKLNSQTFNKSSEKPKQSLSINFCLSVGNARGGVFVRFSRNNECTNYDETSFNCSIHAL